MTAAIIVVGLFVLSLIDLHLSAEIERSGHLYMLLRRRQLRAWRTLVRFVGAGGVAAFLLIFLRTP